MKSDENYWNKEEAHFYNINNISEIVISPNKLDNEDEILIIILKKILKKILIK